MSVAANAHLAASSIGNRLAELGYAGHDPYDALNASRLPPAVLKRATARRALTQLVKRSPLVLQPAIGAVPGVDSYTLGHVLLAESRLAATARDRGRSVDLEALVLRLLQTARTGKGWRAWGYSFPVHTRFFAYEPETPNVIVTAFVVKGLADATRHGLWDARSEIAEAAAFVLDALPRVTDETGQCFGYVPGEKAIIHNANLLAALILCEASELCSEDSWAEEALCAARFAAARQRSDGSWPYSEERYGRWVDGFHTGFVLEGLARVLGTTADPIVQDALDRGLAYYVSQLFGPLGEPKYYPSRARPYDTLSAAQGIETLHVALGGEAACAVPGQVEWAIHRHLRPDGRVAYQVHRGWTDWREFPRWSSAPMMSALAGIALSKLDR